MFDRLCEPRIYLISERNSNLLEYLIFLRENNNCVPIRESEIIEAALFSSLCDYIREYVPDFCGSVPVSDEVKK